MDAGGSVCEREDGKEMRFWVIFYGSYILQIFISAGREACEARFIWLLTDYLFVNISHNIPLPKAPGRSGNIDFHSYRM